MSRQHPGVQLRTWIDMLSVSRKARREEPKNTTVYSMNQTGMTASTKVLPVVSVPAK